MKPQHLKCPYSWEQRHVYFNDRIWFIPSFYDQLNTFTFPGWQDPSFFGNDHPIHVEYCSGNGAWIVAKALAFPQINWVAVEKKFMRVRKIWSKIHNYGLKNLIVICGEGLTATRQYFVEKSIDQVYVNFPDPWPKSRHAKHRIIQTPFADEMARILKPEGKVMLVTDDPDYSKEMINVFIPHESFQSAFPSPYYATSYEGYGTSYFEDLWRQKGKEIHYHEFLKS